MTVAQAVAEAGGSKHGSTAAKAGGLHGSRPGFAARHTRGHVMGLLVSGGVRY
jgi:hypothetical protein